MPIQLDCSKQKDSTYKRPTKAETGAEKGGHAFPPLLPEKPKQRHCSPLHSAADDWQAILLGERKSVLPNARHKSFLSETLAGIDKPGVHLDSPIKMGK